MKIANGAKRFCRCFHRVPTERAVHMKIDETGREIISRKINNFFPARLCLLANCDDFSLANVDFKPVANSIEKNQTRVCKNHVHLTLSLERLTFNAKGRQLRLDSVKSIILGRWI